MDSAAVGSRWPGASRVAPGEPGSEPSSRDQLRAALGYASACGGVGPDLGIRTRGELARKIVARVPASAERPRSQPPSTGLGRRASAPRLAEPRASSGASGPRTRVPGPNLRPPNRLGPPTRAPATSFLVSSSGTRTGQEDCCSSARLRGATPVAATLHGLGTACVSAEARRAARELRCERPSHSGPRAQPPPPQQARAADSRPCNKLPGQFERDTVRGARGPPAPPRRRAAPLVPAAR